MARNFLLALVGATAALASATALAGQDRTIFYNGKVFTSNERQLWAEGVVVEGRLVIAVGTNQQVLALRNRRHEARRSRAPHAGPRFQRRARASVRHHVVSARSAVESPN